MKKHLQRLWHRFLAQDWLAVAAAAGLLAGGLCFIYSASWRGEETGIAGAWFGRQVQWGIVGGAVVRPKGTPSTCLLPPAIAFFRERAILRIGESLTMATSGTTAVFCINDAHETRETVPPAMRRGSLT